MPKAVEPQAYDVVVSLKSGENISNPITVHYVLQGTSATIQNLSLDKDFYDKGDTATLSFFWTVSADNFPGSRGKVTQNESEINLSATITNNKGKECAEPQNQSLDLKTSFIKIPVLIKSNCIDPQLSLSLKDSAGRVLAEKTFNVKTTTKEKESNNNTELIVIIAIALVILVAVGIVLKKKNGDSNGTDTNNNIPMGVLFMFITLFALGALFPTNKASADTATITDTMYIYTFVLSLSKDKALGQYYLLNEDIGVNGNVTIGGCNNSGFPAGASIAATGYSGSTTFGVGQTTGTLAGVPIASDYFVMFDLATPNKTGKVLITYRVAAPTVNVQVNGEKSVTLNTGSSANVTWTTSYMPSNYACNCKCMSGSTEIGCGNSGNGCGSDLQQTTPKIFTNIRQPTTFKVTCEP